MCFYVHERILLIQQYESYEESSFVGNHGILLKNNILNFFIRLEFHNFQKQNGLLV